MLDTNTINFAVNKLTDGFNKILPAMHNVTEEYIKYMVFKTYLIDFSILFFAIISFITYFVTYKKLEADYSVKLDHVVIISGILSICFSILSVLAIFDIILITNNPTMYIITNMMNK